jgi:hypothetical protein
MSAFAAGRRLRLARRRQSWAILLAWSSLSGGHTLGYHDAAARRTGAPGAKVSILHQSLRPQRSTIVNSILHILFAKHMSLLLCAPNGGPTPPGDQYISGLSGGTAG